MHYSIGWLGATWVTHPMAWSTGLHIRWLEARDYTSDGLKHGGYASDGLKPSDAYQPEPSDAYHPELSDAYHG